MKSLTKILVLSSVLAGQVFLSSARAETAPGCEVDPEKVAALQANKDTMQGLIDKMKGENNLDKRYKLLQQHLAEVKKSAKTMDQQYKSLIDLCGHMSSPREDAIISLMEQRIDLLQIVLYQLIQHSEEFESPYKKNKGRPW